ncbi:guanylate-binding protein 1-like isoform X2 [Acipenser ruthenus]|uniref:guanylate-binding protein 1-like isoform X2 n=1 Tax=Acipenser ruthenus TaxID=7906 RepID=UPI002740E65A|nr:guanylate-binding protein 1-like isoform X2 [Acipenser ruthenus]
MVPLSLADTLLHEELESIRSGKRFQSLKDCESASHSRVQHRSDQPASHSRVQHRSDQPASHSRVQHRSGQWTETAIGNNTVAMPAPVCLIENSSTGQLHVNQQALEILTQIDQPVVVVAIVGLYRTGKSYLMNKLAGKRSGFSLGATIQSHTKGIWMWCVPHPCKPGHTLVLLDTEGLGDVEKGDQKNDNWIFTLAVLLSSTLVYNSMGTITDNSVQNLHYVTELTEHLEVKAGDGNLDISSEFARFFPSFVWTVRDFSLDLIMDGKPITADEYLNNSLKLKKGSSKSTQTYNLPRECIRNYFPSRKCFVFRRPTSEDKMRRIEELSDSDLEPVFVEQTKNFCAHIFNNTETKTMKGGFTVTGRLLGRLVETYLDTIASGKVPSLDNAVLALSQIENSAAVHSALTHYKEQMKERVSFPSHTQKELSDVHGQCEAAAVHIFLERCFKDENQRYQLELMKCLQEEYESICRKNEKESEKSCKALIASLFRNVEDRLSSGFYMDIGGYKQYKSDQEHFIRQYKDTPGKGIQADAVLKEFLNGKETMGNMILAADESLSEQQKRIEEDQARRDAMERDRRAIQENQKVLQQLLDDQERSYKQNMEQLLKKLKEDQKTAAEEYDRVLQAKLREQKDLLESGFEEKAKKLENDVRSLSQKKEETQSQSTLSKVMETVGNAASLFLPGIAGRALGVATSFLSRFF